MTDDLSDTKKHDTREIEFELLSKVHDKVMLLGQRLSMLEEQVLILVKNVDTVHKFQRTFAERLYSVEKFCIDQPLRSVSSTSVDNDNGK